MVCVRPELSHLVPNDGLSTVGATGAGKDASAPRTEGPNPSGNSIVINAGTVAHANIAGGDLHVHSDGIPALLDAIDGLVETGKFDRAAGLLAQIEKLHWSGLSPTQKNLHRRLQGRIELSHGKTKEAASRFHEAADFAPFDEKAQVTRGLAFLLEDKRETAHELARSLAQQYPSLKEAIALTVRSSPPGTALQSLVPLPWKGLSPEIATAVAERLLQESQSETALDVLVSVSVPGKKFEYHYALASACQITIEQRIRERINVESGLAARAKDSANAALTLCYGDSEEVRGVRVFLYMTLATAHRMLGELHEEWNALCAAHEVAPEDDTVQCRRSNWLTEKERYSEAVDILERVVARGKLEMAPMLLALPLWKRNQDGDRQRARELLSRVADDTSLAESARKDSVDFLVELAEQVQEWSAIRGFALKYKALLGEYRSVELQALALRQEGDQEGAAQLAMQLYARRMEFTKSAADLGVLLQSCGRNEEAFDVLATTAAHDKWENPTIALLRAATDLDRSEFLIRLCRSLARAGVVNASIVDAEAVALARRGEVGAAIDCAQAYLAKHEDPFIRLRLSTLAIAARRRELVEREPARLPLAQTGLGHAARLVVEVLRFNGRSEDAIRFAYANYRLNRTESEAWNAVIAAFLPVHGSVDHTEPTVVDEQAAVRFREGENVEWLVIEGDAPDLAFGEYPPSHPFAKTLMNHAAGDVVQAPSRGAVPARSYLIEEVRSKYVRCYQQCLDRWERQFPEVPGPQMFLVPDTLEKLDATLAPMLTARQAQVERLERYYAEQACSLHLLACQLGGSVFSAVVHLVSQTSIELRCASPVGDVHALVQSLDAERKLVVQATALATLLMLSETKIWEVLGKRVAVARSTLDELVAHLREAEENPAGLLLLREGQVFIEVADDQRRANYAKLVRDVVAEIEKNCEVFVEPNHELIGHSEWDAWCRVGGAGTAESLHRALRTRDLIWTDDGTLAALLMRKSVQVVWTQATYEHLARIGRIQQSSADEVSARLAGWRYAPTRISPGSLAAAARIATWNPSNFPLPHLFREFSVRSWRVDSTVVLASHALREWWRAAPSDAAGHALTVALLDHIVARSDGSEVIQGVRLVLERVFGIDVFGFERARNALRAWERARSIKL